MRKKLKYHRINQWRVHSIPLKAVLLIMNQRVVAREEVCHGKTLEMHFFLVRRRRRRDAFLFGEEEEEEKEI